MVTGACGTRGAAVASGAPCRSGCGDSRQHRLRRRLTQPLEADEETDADQQQQHRAERARPDEGAALRARHGKVDQPLLDLGEFGGIGPQFARLFERDPGADGITLRDGGVHGVEQRAEAPILYPLFEAQP
jgi:hypothetical protein